MGNKVEIVRTVFHDVNKDQDVVGTTFGIRVNDNFGSHYSECAESQDDLVKLSNEEIMEVAKGVMSEEAIAIITFGQAEDNVIFIDNEEYHIDPQTSGITF